MSIVFLKFSILARFNLVEGNEIYLPVISPHFFYFHVFFLLFLSHFYHWSTINMFFFLLHLTLSDEFVVLSQ